ncbi:exodeoxyribonuclease VII large subunit [Ilumatobacter coccineus]|uniref:Exodeoxyribonuclease 7 large subunit n=1 Tax=Ilumatobacter coccineus (strain NBRC 103263 / KCTC 29153 / YM16-304) TaxID=1313172 RepID=A0A6C7EC50_ILUCY|nr:exodeoxyribonuclease VII large subunit [Ilumatobacter coccineus]BAN04051.1 exodeoxyribonuclease VII large subunit [Ilumatobacter coccineus YM16-304]
MSQSAFDFHDEFDDGVQIDEPIDPTFSVTELADAINQQFRRSFGDGLWVRGEINGLTRRGPHVYFSLIEHGDSGKAKIDIKLFAPAIKRLTPLLKQNRLDLRDGMKVRIHGFLDFWAQGGSVGLKMDGIDPKFTLGDIAQSRDEVMRRLVAGGLIDLNKQWPLSPIPLRIGVATSLDSAAWADFHHEIEKSGFGFHLTVADTRVQGDGAERMVAGAIGTLARGARKGVLDAIVVIRGGGARNELAVFDTEIIARTIAAVPVPVFTGIGHEIDRSIADEAAHTALKTPTACAGALIDRVSNFVANTEMAWQAIERRATATLDAAERRLGDVGHRIAARTQSAIDRSNERLDMRLDVLGTVAPAVLERAHDRLDTAAERLIERSSLRVERETGRLDLLAARVAAVDPAVQLARGWSITRTASGQIVRSADDVATGDTLTTALLDGEITSVVEAVNPDPQSEPQSESDSADD